MELIHRGAEGTVWRAVTLGGSSTREVAIKQLHHDFSPSAWRARWSDRRALMTNCGGPGCIEVLEVFEGAPPHGADLAGRSMTSLFEVSAWVEGLRFDLWAADQNVGGADRLSVLCGLAAVIERLHDQSVIHRDIAPGNVIVNAHQATLIDFGLVARLGDDGRVIETEIIGTTGFRSPEAALGAWSVAADRWSFGAMCHLALSGYESEHPGATSVIAALLSEEPRERPPLSLFIHLCDV